jgi:hypothetical protein
MNILILEELKKIETNMNKRIFPTKISQINFFSHNIISSRETCDMNNSCMYLHRETRNGEVALGTRI